MSARTWCTCRLAPRDQDKVAETGGGEGGRGGRGRGGRGQIWWHRVWVFDVSCPGPSPPLCYVTVFVLLMLCPSSSFFYFRSPSILCDWDPVVVLTGSMCVYNEPVMPSHNINIWISLFGTKRKWPWVLWVEASHKHTFPPKHASDWCGGGGNRSTGTVFRRPEGFRSLLKYLCYIFFSFSCRTAE